MEAQATDPGSKRAEGHKIATIDSTRVMVAGGVNHERNPHEPAVRKETLRWLTAASFAYRRRRQIPSVLLFADADELSRVTRG